LVPALVFYDGFPAAAEQRRKEIVIRKVMGASAQTVTGLLSAVYETGAIASCSRFP